MKINKQAFGALVIYPLFLLVLFIIYCKYHFLSKTDFIYFLVGFYVTNSVVCIALHRFYTHDAFKTSKLIEFIFCFFTAAVMQGPVIAWVSDHRKHHAYTDKELDPHTPNKYQNKIKGFLWSHIGWMLFKESENKIIDTITMKKFSKNKLLVWQLKNYWKLVIFMNLIPPFLLGYCLNGSILGGMSSFLFIGLGRCLQQQITFCVNSACHFWGDKPYYNGSARNVWWLAPLLMGENYHNFHHAFPNDYRNGVKWYQLDCHKWVIYLMSKIGLVWDLDITSDVRIDSKVADMKKQSIKGQWQKLNQMYEGFRDSIFIKINEIDNKGLQIKYAVTQKLYELKAIADSMINDINIFIEEPERSTKDLLNISRNTFIKLQKSFATIQIT